MKRFWKLLQEWANRHKILVLLTLILIGSIIGCSIGAVVYHPVEASKIKSIESIAKDVYKNTYEFVQKHENISIEIPFKGISKMTETDLSLFKDLTASVEKNTVRISEKEVIVEIDFSKENTDVQEKNSRLDLLLWGITLGAVVGFEIGLLRIRCK